MTAMVSIICNSYNHEKYISIALESFLMQRTTFEFEILVHDDASTDMTQEIITYFADLYPNIVKPILQKENKMSQGIDIDFTYQIPRAKGKYITLCEGDDYWTDMNKLQKQFEFMEDHPEVSLCVHADKNVNESGKKIIRTREMGKDQYLTNEDIIDLEGAIATNSYFMRARYLESNKVPQWYFDSPVGDYPLLLYFSQKGKVYFMNDIMSAYRIASKGSWTETVYHVPELRKKHFKKMKELLKSFNQYSNYRYQKKIEQHMLENEFTVLCGEADIAKMKTKRYRDLYKKLSSKYKAKLYVKRFFPFLVSVRRKLERSGIIYWFKPNEALAYEEVEQCG